MEIKALGAVGEVGRSAYLIKSREGNLLLDYGIKLQGQELPQYPRNPYELVNTIDLCLVSHGHLDHIGYLPWLYRKHRFIWYTTPPTLDIAKVLWKDSIKLAKLKGIEDHFHYKAMEKAEKNWYPALYGSRLQYGDYDFMFHNASHILGSSSISVNIEGQRVVYSGDVGYRSLLEKELEHPGKADKLLIETTYADKEHPPIEKEVDKLMELIYDSLDNGGHALLPAFAIGRTQELLHAIYKRDKSLPIYVDGMGREITRIYLKYGVYLRDFDVFEDAVRGSTLVESPRQRKEALSKPSVIITTAGMMDGGPVLYYIDSLLPNSKIILNGYQAEGSNGRMLEDKGKIMIDGKAVKIRHEVHHLDFSAHIGRSQILDYIKKADPEELYLVHSEKEKAEKFSQELREEGYNVVM
ncbi:MAG: MBL fold metallo-hydrolase [Methanobacteriota archaeon]|nr:MAG: MBL fold metallo-hydrolase [Euryarchaeota archaeon]